MPKIYIPCILHGEEIKYRSPLFVGEEVKSKKTALQSVIKKWLETLDKT